MATSRSRAQTKTKAAIENENTEKPKVLASIENIQAGIPKSAAVKATKKEGPAKRAGIDNSKALKDEIEALTAKLTHIQIEAAKKDAELSEKEAENVKLQDAVKKLKAKRFEPTVDLSYLGEIPSEANDPRKPKPPVSAYIRFCNKFRKDVSEGLPPTEVIKKLAEMWKEASDKEKLPFEEELKVEVEAYLPIKEAYDQIAKKEKVEQKALTMLQEEKRADLAKELLMQYETYYKERSGTSMSKKKKDPEKPTAAKSAWMIFMDVQRVKIAESEEKLPFAESMTRLASMWKELTPKEKAVYDKMAVDDKVRCHQEMEVYNLKKEEENAKLRAEQEAKLMVDLPLALDLVKKQDQKKIRMKKIEQLAAERKEGLKEEKLRAKIAKALVPKKPKNAWGLFMTEKRKEVVEQNPTLAFGEVSSKLAALWKALAPEEKQTFESKAAPALAAYKVVMTQYRNAHPEAISTTTTAANSRATSVAEDDVADMSDVADAPETYAE